MSQGGPASLVHAVAELRRAFDRSFAEPPRGEVVPAEAFLAIRAGGDAWALRLGEIAGLFKDRKVTPLPTAAPGLLGIAGLRGGLFPVYDLATLLGHPRSEPPRWLVLAKGADPLALAFDVFEGHLRVPRERVTAAGPGGVVRHAERAVRVGDAARPILDVVSIVREIENRARSDGPAKER